MAMQSGKGTANGSGPTPALSDEQAEELAASFKPAWDTGDDEDDAPPDFANTVVDPGSAAAAAAAAAVAAAPAPAPAPPAPAAAATPAQHVTHKATMIGMAAVPLPAAAAAAAAAPAPAVRAPQPSAEAIDPENVLEVQSAPALPTKGKTMPLGAVAPQVLKPQPAPAAAPMAGAPARNGVARAADPFRAVPPEPISSPDLDYVPKKSKTVYIVIAGLAVAAGLGLFLKFALTDDAPKPSSAQPTTGPAVTKEDIPPPPPKDEAPPATTAKAAPSPTAAAATTAATAATTAAATPPSPPPAAPKTEPAAKPEPKAAVAAAGPRPRTPPPPPPPPAAATPPPAPKTAPKGPPGGIVRDSPF